MTKKICYWMEHLPRTLKKVKTKNRRYPIAEITVMIEKKLKGIEKSQKSKRALIVTMMKLRDSSKSSTGICSHSLTTIWPYKNTTLTKTSRHRVL